MQGNIKTADLLVLHLNIFPVHSSTFPLHFNDIAYSKEP